MAIFEAFVAWTILVVLVESYVFKSSRVFVKNFNKRLNQKLPNYTPSVSVIVPFKGFDHQLKANIKSILNQDYKRKEFIFVYDNKKDSAYRVLKEVKKTSKQKIVLLEKSKNFKDCSAKVASQLTAIQKAKGEVWAFADSDIFTESNWLEELVRPLQKKKIGVTTGFRSYFPLKNSMAPYAKSAWDSIGFGIMLSNMSFVWGGSFAMKKETFKELQIEKVWKTAIADDITITPVFRKNKREIFFVPRALVASFDDNKWSELIEWTNRQVFFIRHFEKKIWKLGLVSYGYFNLVWISSIAGLIIGLVQMNQSIFAIGVLLGLIEIFVVTYKVYNRKIIVTAVPSFKEHLSKHKIRRVLAQFLSQPLAFYNLVKTTNMYSITWRGFKYKIGKDGKVKS